MRRLNIRRTVLVVLAALVVAWITTTVVLINRSPAAGARDPAALATAYEQALSTHDSGAVGRLVFRPPDDDTAGRLREQSVCGRAPISVRAVDDAYLELSAVDGTPCGRLPIGEHDGRWYVDPWADLPR